jgi:hypothetical protein
VGGVAVSGRLVRTADGSLRFKYSALTPRLRRYAERKRLDGERLNAEHEERLFTENMALLGKTELTGTRGADTEFGDGNGSGAWASVPK